MTCPRLPRRPGRPRGVPARRTIASWIAMALFALFAGTTDGIAWNWIKTIDEYCNSQVARYGSEFPPGCRPDLDLTHGGAWSMLRLWDYFPDFGENSDENAMRDVMNTPQGKAKYREWLQEAIYKGAGSSHPDVEQYNQDQAWWASSWTPCAGVPGAGCIDESISIEKVVIDQWLMGRLKHWIEQNKQTDIPLRPAGQKTFADYLPKDWCDVCTKWGPLEPTLPCAADRPTRRETVETRLGEIMRVPEYNGETSNEGAQAKADKIQELMGAYDKARGDVFGTLGAACQGTVAKAVENPGGLLKTAKVTPVVSGDVDVKAREQRARVALTDARQVKGGMFGASGDQTKAPRARYVPKDGFCFDTSSEPYQSVETSNCPGMAGPQKGPPGQTWIEGDLVWGNYGEKGERIELGRGKIGAYGLPDDFLKKPEKYVAEYLRNAGSQNPCASKENARDPRCTISHYARSPTKVAVGKKGISYWQASRQGYLRTNASGALEDRSTVRLKQLGMYQHALASYNQAMRQYQAITGGKAATPGHSASNPYGLGGGQDLYIPPATYTKEFLDAFMAEGGNNWLTNKAKIRDFVKAFTDRKIQDLKAIQSGTRTKPPAT